VADAARDQEFTLPDDRRLIPADAWDHQRWGWLESVRRDEALSPMARLVAHVLVLDFANRRTQRCDPSLREIAGVLGTSQDTVKRAIKVLVESRWIVREEGRGRGRASGYGFLTRAKIVPIKGGKSAPPKGGEDAPFYRSQKGADLHRKGGKSAPAYNKDKPCKNHEGRAGASAGAENPLLVRDAERAVAAFREGRRDALAETRSWVLNYILTANLLTPEEREAAGLS